MTDRNDKRNAASDAPRVRLRHNRQDIHEEIPLARLIYYIIVIAALTLAPVIHEYAYTGKQVALHTANIHKMRSVWLHLRVLADKIAAEREERHVMRIMSRLWEDEVAVCTIYDFLIAGRITINIPIILAYHQNQTGLPPMQALTDIRKRCERLLTDDVFRFDLYTGTSASSI